VKRETLGRIRALLRPVKGESWDAALGRLLDIAEAAEKAEKIRGAA
jgi:hypothetical protein